MRVESILHGEERVIADFQGNLKEEGTHKKGIWFVTSRRLIYLPSPEVRTDWKKTVIGGALFGGVGGTLGTEVEIPESFEDYRLDSLISIDFLEERGNVLRAVFETGGHNRRTVLIEVNWPHDFKSEVEEAKEHLEEEH